MAGKKKILVIDDEEDFCSLVKMNLEATGALEVLTCCSSRMAIRQVRTHHPDLIFLDVMMPGKDGPGIAAELKAGKDTQDIPIVFLTALVSEEDTERDGGLIGERFFIAKPAQTDKLINIINVLTSQ